MPHLVQLEGMKIVNRTFHREYSLLEKYEAGVVLTGGEVKSLKNNRGKLEGAFVKLRPDGAYLINAEIAAYAPAQVQNYDPTRSRKLLLHTRELIRLQTKLSERSGLTIIPISWYNKGNRIKLEIALVKGKRTWEKKSVEKNRDEARRIEKEAKEYLKK